MDDIIELISKRNKKTKEVTGLLFKWQLKKINVGVETWRIYYLKDALNVLGLNLTGN